MNHTELILAGQLYRCKQFAYDATNQLIYEGYHLDPNAGDGDKHWHIFKHSWTDGKKTKTQGPLIGTWTGRAALPW